MSATKTNNNYRVIGTRPVRPDGVDKVTGRAIYGADVVLPRQAHGKILRSPHAHARILRLDTTAAAALPGVFAIATSEDLPRVTATAHLGEGGDANIAHMSANVLARDKVLYHGHAIAAVAAVSPHVAEQAIRLIEVEYEPLPAVLTCEEAMAAGASLLHPEIYTDTAGEKATEPSNVAAHLIFEEGDIEAGFAAATTIVEREFRTASVHQGYIEPHAATAEWKADGQLTVWCCTQGAFPARSQLTLLLQHPISQIKVVPTEIGGGFGGKISVYVEPVAAILAKKSGRPVRVTMSRADVLTGTGPSPGSHMKIKVGVDDAGMITAAQAYLAFEAGAYPGSPIAPGCMTVFAPYKLANVRIDGYDVVNNKPKSAAYRAPGATQAEFAAECVIDEICVKLGIDPIEFRLKNGVKEGDWRAGGPPYGCIGNLQCLEATQNSPHWQTPLDREAKDGKRRGRGMASGYWFNIGLTSSANGRLNPDGTITLQEGSTDIGGSRASIAMQFAEEFGVEYAAVHPSVADTESVGFTEVTGGSRTTFATGWAAYELAREMKRRIVAELAALWETTPDQITIEGAEYAYNGKRLGLTEIAKEMDEHGKQITASTTVSPTGSGGAFGIHIADVEVDTETGKVEVLRYTAVQDAGTAIHPSYVEGQMQGGAVQGIGWALNEEYFYDTDGRLRNASLLDYRMPTTLDVPMIETIIVEIPNPGHPYGVRGVGEVPIIPPPAAVANAIADAIGIRFQDLPMNPPRVFAALHPELAEG